MGLARYFTDLLRHRNTKVPSEDPSNTKKRVTVLIPTFNRPEMLERAISSVLGCGYDRLLIRVFDNGASTQAGEIVRKFRRQPVPILYQQNESNIGPIRNFQQALASVDTEYFLPLADDDWIYEGFVAKAVSLLEKDASLGAAIFVTEARDQQGNLLETYPQALDQRRFGRLSPKEHLEDWLVHGHYHWSSILWRKDALERVGPPFLHAGLPSDVDFQVRVFAAFPVYLVNQPGAGYLIHEGQSGAELSVSHLADWAKIFVNLDHLVAANALFERDTYQRLRKIALARYQPLWRRGGNDAGMAQQQKWALMAGFCLSDWDLAYALAQSWHGNAQGAEGYVHQSFPPHWPINPSNPTAKVDELVVSYLQTQLFRDDE